MNRPHTKNNLLVISALGKDKPGIVNDLTHAILKYDGNIVDSRMTVLGGEFAIIFMVSGQWNNIAQIEDSLPKLAESFQLTITAKRTEERSSKSQYLPYSIEVVSFDNPGIVHHLANFFSCRQINIEELSTNSYAAAHTGTPMFTVQMSVEIPTTTQISTLRDEFMEFCDDLNLDANIDPRR